MLHTRHPRQTITRTSLFLVTSALAACDVVLGIEPGVSWCDGKPEGTSLPNQIDGDCQEIICDGNGKPKVQLADDADDKNPCTIDRCDGSKASHQPIDNPNVPCYDGPAGTEGKGPCVAGHIECDSMGNPTCVGAVLPKNSEVCQNGIDDDCDGVADQNNEGCYCGDGQVTPALGEECDDGGITAGDEDTCSSQCTLVSCKNGTQVALAINQLLLGDINPDGTSNPTNGWKQYGFNLDGLVSTKTSTNLCKPQPGGTNAQVYLDGPEGIDNSFGKNILPIFLGMASDLPATVNEAITQGELTHIYTLTNIGPVSCSTSSAFFLGSNLGKPPLFDGTDVWPIDPSSLVAPNLLPLVPNARTIWWGTTKIINGHVTTDAGAQFDLALDLSGPQLILPIRNARLEFQFSGDQKSATSGILGGIIRTEDLVDQVAKMVAAFDASFCDPFSPTLVSILNQIRQASDIMVNGGQDPNAECDGISIGLGFTMKAVQLGSVAEPAKPPMDPCLPAPLCTNGYCPAPSCGNSSDPQSCGRYNNENCCVSPFVPGGTYHRGNDSAYPASVSDFYFDRFEVTVGRFRKFVEAYPTSKPVAGAGAHPKIQGSGWDSSWDTNLPTDKAALDAALKCDPVFHTWTDTPGANENLPINCVNWYQAFTFCAWDGGRLPTEAEWNYAAAGGNDQWPYPWGFAALDLNHAVFGCQGDGQCTLADISSVGSKSPLGDGRWGQADLSGSMWEWTLDLYQSPYQNPCVDCANLQNGSGRVVRGGSWFENQASTFQTNHQAYINPSDPYKVMGFRCARNP